MTETETIQKKGIKNGAARKKIPKWNIRMMNDDVTCVEFVILVLSHILRMDIQAIEHSIQEAQTAGSSIIAYNLTRDLTDIILQSVEQYKILYDSLEFKIIPEEVE